MPATSDSIKNRPHYSSLVFACIALIPGVIGLSGWIGDSFLLRSFFSTGTTMKVDTALFLIACAVSLIFFNTGKYWVAKGLLAAAATFSLLILVEHIGHVNLGVDEWWFKDKDYSQLHEPPGRTSALASISTICVCAMALLALYKKYYTSQVIAFLLFLILYAALLGQLFGAAGLYRQGVYSGMAFHTTTSLLLLCTSILLYQARHGWMQLFVLKLNGRKGLRYILIYLFTAAPLLVAFYMYFTNQKRFSHASGIITLIVISAFISISAAYSVLNRISKTEGQLSLANQRLQIALNAAQLGSYDLELATGQMKCSNQCLANFGLSEGSAFHFPDLIQAIQPKYQQQMQDRVAQSIATHTNYYAEYQVLWPDKSVHWIKASGSPQYDIDGNAVCMIGITQDITVEKEAEAKKNSFIGIVSHELKTPLTSIKGYIQILKSKADGDTFRVNALSRAEVQVNKMASMINGFLDVARLESGTMQLVLSCFSINSLIEEIIDECRFIYNNHIIRFSPCPEVMVTADREKIEHLIANLLGNAVKYSLAGKTIELSCKQIEQQVQVSVKDQGVGIKFEEIPRLFERFFRAESHNNNHNISGFGIGLYLSAEIIKMHHGKIWVESELGVGSTFHFNLPIVE